MMLNADDDEELLLWCNGLHTSILTWVIMLSAGDDEELLDQGTSQPPHIC
jgi:hypothetical protein